MQKFFFPNSTKPEDVYEGVKKFLKSQGFEIKDDRIYSISYTHNDREITDVVDKKNQLINENVLAIFNAKSMFLVCTISRGVAGGVPILVGSNEVLSYVLFDS
jgi:hypothetical protein